MSDRIHRNKKYMAIFYDRCEQLDRSFTDAEIGEIVRGAIRYELKGEKPEIADRALSVMCSTLCADIDIMTAKADKWSATQSKRVKEGRWGKRDKSEGMTLDEMDAEIDSMFPRSK